MKETVPSAYLEEGLNQAKKGSEKIEALLRDTWPVDQ